MTAQPAYDLHKLGWRGFQDLCALVLQEVLGQTFTTFADTNDVGKDGAFHGAWRVPGDSVEDELGVGPSSRTVVQAKFSVSKSDTLKPSSLEDEFAKLKRLVDRGDCDSYLVLTNLRVSGASEEKIVGRALGAGVTVAKVLDGHWISQQIAKSPSLRRLVPRVYGLGDLAMIMDDRAIEQAKVLLDNLGSDFETFVPTEAYRRAVETLAKKHVVILLGEPAAGKSTIARTLAMAALDSWGGVVKRVDDPSALERLWDPKDPAQIFWADDVFGSVRHDPALTDGWARRMEYVNTMIKEGCRFVLTSRNYIYDEARQQLKENRNPSVFGSQVTVRVTDLTDAEKNQMLYNHLRAGDQPARVLNAWKLHLPEVAKVDPFQPEVARRLGLSEYTLDSGLTDASQLVEFMAHPHKFLGEILGGLSASSRAALGVLFVAGGRLPQLIVPTKSTRALVARMGSDLPQALAAFDHLNGTFVRLETNSDGESEWRFHHPTVREAFAKVIEESPGLVDILIEGYTLEELATNISCRAGDVSGARLVAPKALYAEIAQRMILTSPSDRSVTEQLVGGFLAFQVSDVFLEVWWKTQAPSVSALVQIHWEVGTSWPWVLLSHARRAGLLSNLEQMELFRTVGQRVDWSSSTVWMDAELSGLLTETERKELIENVRESLDDDLGRCLWEASEGYEPALPPGDRADSARDLVGGLRRMFDGDPAVEELLDRAMSDVEDFALNEPYSEADDWDDARDLAIPSGPAAASVEAPRSLYEDVDAGHA